MFYNRELNYADKNRRFIFIVYVYDFESPITVQVAFSRRTRVQLLHFFITFFGCLLSLLIIAFITWKARQCYVDHRNERQRIASQVRMSNRPFTRLFIDVINSEEKEKLMMQTGQAQNKVSTTKMSIILFFKNYLYSFHLFQGQISKSNGKWPIDKLWRQRKTFAEQSEIKVETECSCFIEQITT